MGNSFRSSSSSRNEDRILEVLSQVQAQQQMQAQMQAQQNQVQAQMQAQQNQVLAQQNQMQAQMQAQQNQVLAQQNQMQAQQNQVLAQQNQMQAQQNQMQAQQNQILLKVDDLTRTNYERDLNPWLCMAETDRSRVQNLRQKLFRKFGLDETSAVCWLTGKPLVKVAHILPDSCNKAILESLKLPKTFKNETEGSEPKNLLLLHPTIEEAFDALQVSFLPLDLFNPTRFRLHIWDDSCRGIAVDTANTIGDYEGSELGIPHHWRVSRRALSYQAYHAYLYNKSRQKFPEATAPPDDFSSEFDGKIQLRDKLQNLLETSIREEVQELEDEKEDD